MDPFTVRNASPECLGGHSRTASSGLDPTTVVVARERLEFTDTKAHWRGEGMQPVGFGVLAIHFRY